MKEEEKEFPSFPVTTWDIGYDDDYNVIVFRPHFLSHPHQDLDEAHEGRFYVLSARQARQLIRDIQEQLDLLEKSVSSIPGHLKH